jgi:pimeloyl-ACP methyl ester carboxylesterase
VTAPLSLTRTGSGEPLLLLHGLGTSRRDFTAVLPALTDRFDVINVDLPGIGRSPHLEQRPTVAAITDAIEHTLDAEGCQRSFGNPAARTGFSGLVDRSYSGWVPVGW